MIYILLWLLGLPLGVILCCSCWESGDSWRGATPVRLSEGGYAPSASRANGAAG